MTAAPEWRLVRHDTLPSTSDACIAEAQAGAPAGLAIQARIQTKARGSRGRSWSEAAGTLAVSVLLRPKARLAWPLLAAVAFHDALSLLPKHAEALRLKWPNDVMLHGRKLGGILIEASPSAAGPFFADDGWLVIGFGANLASAPALADRHAACLAELGDCPDADALVDRLLKSLTCGLAAGERDLREAWLARAHPEGTWLEVGTTQGVVQGSFASIAADGALLLDVAGTIRRLTSGDVLLPQGA
ncbi:biotin--[acetyl-CoA-carboxylase] ligase [Lichenicoccus sp.]|uniref:biotin--[acetyl-CoA-carboxylase] ligase n=1 Tax=Lichenicoccus sp. TaxID=2781899 RepID=UPI003D0C41E6